jgi:predicted nucleic acid-binding protein
VPIPVRGTEDAQSASICSLHGASLATRNVKDFDGVEVDLLNLEIVD